MYAKEIYEFITSLWGILLINLMWGWGLFLMIYVLGFHILCFLIELYKPEFEPRLQRFNNSKNINDINIKRFFGGAFSFGISLSMTREFTESPLDYYTAFLLVLFSAIISAIIFAIIDWITYQIMRYFISVYDRIRREQANKKVMEESEKSKE